MKIKRTKELGLAVGLASLTLALTSSAATITTIDLSGGTTPVNNGVNGGYVFAIAPQSTGTGVIDPFLREQNNGSESGINTSINNPPLDDKSGPWTHDLTVSQLATVTYNSATYYKFVLDANQTGNGPISLTQFKIFTTTGSAATSVGQLNTILASTPNFNMNGGANTYRVDVSSQNGSGSGDMYILVPTSDLPSSGNLYLYAAFGQDANGNGYATDDGFEEWYALRPDGTVLPPLPDGGSTVALMGAGLAGLALLRRKLC